MGAGSGPRSHRSLAQDNKDRCQSGLMGTPGKRVCRKRYRGFESLPVRHSLTTRGLRLFLDFIRNE